MLPNEFLYSEALAEGYIEAVSALKGLLNKAATRQNQAS